MEMPSYYAIIPANVRYDKDLKANEKLLYSEITCLTHKTGECWANNKYFSELYGVTPRAIQTWLGHLKDRGYIRIDLIYKQGSKEVEKRIIRICGESNFITPHEQNFMTPHEENFTTPHEQNFVDNNTSINNTSINSIGVKPHPPKEPKRFTPPTVEEVNAYCFERKNGIDAQQFVDFYSSKGWYVGKNKMKDWKAAVRTWENRGKSSYSGRTTKVNNIEVNQDFREQMRRNQADIDDLLGFNV